MEKCICVSANEWVAEDHNINFTVIEWLYDIQSCFNVFLTPKTYTKDRHQDHQIWVAGYSYDHLKVLGAIMAAI